MFVQFLEEQVAVVPLEIMGDQHERAVSGVRMFQMPDLGHEFLHGRKLVALVVEVGLGTDEVHLMGFTLLLHAFAIEKGLDGGVLLGIVHGSPGAGGLGSSIG